MKFAFNICKANIKGEAISQCSQHYFTRGKTDLVEKAADFDTKLAAFSGK